MSPSRPTRSPLLCGLALLLGACSEEGEPQITPVDGLREDLPPEVLRQVAALDPRVDSDGDGLSDVDELVGWTIRVDETGRPQGILVREVFSDPDMADTDGDGLLDGVERMVGSDPDVTDTDGDGLSDFEEVMRWGTSPASVDSDGDSRGENPDPSGAPDVTLFDAAELQLTDDPSNPGGPKIAGPLATSPLHGDTDGDGVWDWSENATRVRSSTIADTPILRVDVNAASKAGFYLNLTITEGQVRTETVGKELTFGGGVSSTVSTSTKHTLATWFDQWAELGLVVNIGVNTEQAGADAGLVFNSASGVGISNTLTTEVAIEGTMSTEFSQVLTDVEELAKSRTQTVDGGIVALLVDVTNVGPVPAKIRNLSVQLARYEPRTGSTHPVAQLKPAAAGDADIVLGIGESVTVQLENREVEAGRMMALMKNPGLMVLSPANFDVLSAGDEDYAFIEADVADRTATIELDLAENDVRTFKVAALVNRDASGRRSGVSVGEVLDRVGLTWDADPIPEGPDSLLLQRYVFKIGDRVTELHDGPAPSLNDPAPYPEGREPGPRKIKRGWFSFIQRRSGLYEFDDQLFVARLLPGDRASLLFLEDLDRDGLSSEEERIKGTSDTKIDSDGDGLSDWWETKVGWTVAVRGQVPLQVISNPAVMDTDGDGLPDFEERARGTNPWSQDTDLDGISDKAEVDASTDPLVFDGRYPVIEVDCAALNTTNRDGRVAVHEFKVSDPDADLVSVRLVWTDGVVTSLKFAPTGENRPRLARGSAILHVEATDARGHLTSLSCAQ